jgi:hypothetical protein
VGGKPTIQNSLHIWAERGIVGRGVLLDYRYAQVVREIESNRRSWALKNGTTYDACRAPAHRISAAKLDQVAKDQGVELRMGDILFLRTGYIEWYNNSDMEERVRVAKQYPPDIVGIEQTEESIRWLWYIPTCIMSTNSQGTIILRLSLLTTPQLSFVLRWLHGTFTITCFPCGEHPLASCLIWSH